MRSHWSSGVTLEQVALGGAVALADDQLKPPAGQVVKRRVVLERPHRVEQRQRRHRREQPDPLVSAARWLSTTVGEEEMNGRSCRSPTPKPSKPSSSASRALSMTSRNRSAVETLRPGDRVRGVHDQRDGDEPHDAALAAAARRVRAGRRPSGASPRWSRSVVPV